MGLRESIQTQSRCGSPMAVFASVFGSDGFERASRVSQSRMRPATPRSICCQIGSPSLGRRMVGIQSLHTAMAACTRSAPDRLSRRRALARRRARRCRTARGHRSSPSSRGASAAVAGRRRDGRARSGGRSPRRSCSRSAAPSAGRCRHPSSACPSAPRRLRRCSRPGQHKVEIGHAGDRTVGVEETGVVLRA